MIICGNAPTELQRLPDNSIDACVTDAPYELGFMGRKWDKTGIAYKVDLWAEVLRVLKPGAHLLAFGGTRTYHRMACAIEDAGFECRDTIMWHQGSGFPKSLDVSKQIDKIVGAPREKVPPRSVIGHQRNIGNRRPYMDVPDHLTDSDVPISEAAKAWSGWGTSLKPATEIICLARKPLSEPTVAANVLKWRTGALNIDASRVRGPRGNGVWGSSNKTINTDRKFNSSPDMQEYRSEESSLGRWPANVILENTPEVIDLFPVTKSGSMKAGTPRNPENTRNAYGEFKGNRTDVDIEANSGSAARFFKQVSCDENDIETQRLIYCAKASPKERNAGVGLNGNVHPTVKPVALMRYLVKLITPPSGTVLDMFFGSGSTGVACIKEGFDFVGIEQDESYVEIARRRVGEEPTHLRCADCNNVTPIDDLALQHDGRRTCDDCSELAILKRIEREGLEEVGQERLF